MYLERHFQDLSSCRINFMHVVTTPEDKNPISLHPVTPVLSLHCVYGVALFEDPARTYLLT